MARSGFDEIWPTIARDHARAEAAGPGSPSSEGPGLASVVRTIRPHADYPALTLATLAGVPAHMEPVPVGSWPTAVAPTTPSTDVPSSIPGVVRAGSLPRLSIATPSPDGRTAELEVRGLLGQGGMGRVLLGSQRSLARDVAIKTPHQGAPEGAGQALVLEAVVMGGLEHPNIVPVHLLGLDGTGQPMLVMKRVVGVAWGELLEDPAHPAWSRLPMLPRDRTRAHVEILAQVASALAFAHSRGLVHRDLKPDNVMIGEFGEVYLMDWGLATRLGEASRELCGTPCYMAPEMIAPGGVPDARTDVYLLGATLHHVLSGTPRHAGTVLREVLAAAWTSAPVAYPPEVPAELAALANQATSADPSARPASAVAFRQALVDHLAHRSSASLAEAADERLGTLEDALAGRADLRPGDVSRLGQECRFGYAMARREWPESPRANAGLERCLRVLAELELRAGNVAAAVALADELATPDEDLAARIATARAAQDDRDAAAARLAELEREGDLRIAVRARRNLIAVLIAQIVVYGLAFVVARHYDHPLGRVTPLVLALLSVSFLLVLGVGVSLGKRTLLSTTINRRYVAALAISLGLVTLNRFSGLLAGLDYHSILRADMYLTAAAAGVAGFMTESVWLPGAALMIVGALVSDVWPQHNDVVFSICGVLLLLTLGRVRPPRPPRAAPPDPPRS